MSSLRIRIYGDPALKMKASPVEKIGPQEKGLLEEMAQKMYSIGGLGLAATQVGVPKQLMVVDVGSGLLKLANPKIVKAHCKMLGEEGCLSFPDLTVKIKRPEKVVLEALNQEGAKIKMEAEGLLARALQHEIDHLMGIVIVDRIGLREKLFIARQLLQLKKLSSKGVTR